MCQDPAVEIEGAGKDTAASIWHPRALSVLDQKNVDLSSTQRRESAPRECDPLPAPAPSSRGLWPERTGPAEASASLTALWSLLQHQPLPCCLTPGRRLVGSPFTGPRGKGDMTILDSPPSLTLSSERSLGAYKGAQLHRQPIPSCPGEALTKPHLSHFPFEL